MRICLVTSKMNFAAGGGSVLDLDLIARTLQKKGHEVAIVTLFAHENNFPKDLPYKIYEEDTRKQRLIPIQRHAYKILKKYEAHANVFFVEAHTCLYGIGAYRAFGGGAPVIAFFNRELSAWPEDKSALLPGFKRDGFFTRIKKKARYVIEKYFLTPFANRIDVITFTNPVLQKEYNEFGIKKENNMIIGDPFDYRAMLKDNAISENWYANRNKTQGPINLFYSSRMAAGKGFDLLIAAFSKLKNKENFRLILGGSGPEEANVSAMVKNLGLESYIDMPGWVPRAELFNSLKNKADIFVQARWRTDMTSTSLLFAMAFGLPCILPGGGGLEWAAGGAALYFKDGDVEDLAKKIDELGSDSGLRAELSRQCYKRLNDDVMNHEKVIAGLEEVMRGLKND